MLTPKEQPQATLLLYRGISFERRGDLYAALDCYREGMTQATVGTDIHQEFAQILTSLQGRLAQPGARGPHYDSGAMGDPQNESHEVRRCYELYRSAYGRRDWQTAQQTLELVIKYRPFFVVDQRSAWKLLEEVRIRATTPPDTSKGMPVWGWALLVVGFCLTAVVVYRTSGIQTPVGVVGGNSGSKPPPSPVAPVTTPGQVPTPVPTAKAPRLVLKLPDSIGPGKELKLVTQVVGPDSTIQLTWSADRGAVVNLKGDTWWRPPPDAKAGEVIHLTVQARDGSGGLSAPMQHAIKIQ